MTITRRVKPAPGSMGEGKLDDVLKRLHTRRFSLG
jgi:hypothetical protein